MEIVCSDRNKYRFNSLFASCDVVFLQVHVNSDPHYATCRAYLMDLYLNDLEFQRILSQDAEMVYNSSQQKDKISLLEKIKEDISEHCVHIFCFK